jgi:hypothetical protein
MRELIVEEPASREEYVRRVLEAYRQTPGTTGRVHPPDRRLAAQLYQRGVPLETVQNALALAAARRLFRPPDAPPLTTVRSLAYFVPAIEEVLELKISSDYFQYVRDKLQHFRPT